MNKKILFFLAFLTAFAINCFGQYVQPERDDTIRLTPKITFDIALARNALSKGTSTIKGVAFTRPRDDRGRKLPFGDKIYANRERIYLYPVTPYLLEYLELRKKEDARKLRFVYTDQNFSKYLFTSITNSDGEFSFPGLKPGKYYIESYLGWNQQGTYDEKVGYVSGSNSSADVYQTKRYSRLYEDLIYKFVEVTAGGEVIDIKLK